MFLLFILILHSQTQWYSYTANDGAFSFEVPAKTEILKGEKEILTSSGPLQLIIYKSKDSDEYGNSYTMSYIDYPNEIITDTELQDSLILETISGLPGELIYDQASNKLGQKTRNIRKKLTDQALHLKANLFFDSNRFIMLMVYVDQDQSLNSNINHFLNSYRKIKTETID